MEQINKTNKQTLHSEHELKLAEKQKWENKNVICPSRPECSFKVNGLQEKCYDINVVVICEVK